MQKKRVCFDVKSKQALFLCQNQANSKHSLFAQRELLQNTIAIYKNRNSFSPFSSKKVSLFAHCFFQRAILQQSLSAYYIF